MSFFTRLVTFVSIVVPFYVSALNGQSFHEDKTKICVVFVIKDNEDVIGRCLHSIKKIANCVFVCDTGSKDSTVYIFDSFEHATNIPVQIGKLPVDEAQNESAYAFKNAQKFIRELRFVPEETYFLFLDPDMQLHVPEQFNKSSLTQDAYALMEKSSTLPYYIYNLRLLRSSLPWKNAQETDGSWYCEHVVNTSKLSWRIYDQGIKEIKEEKIQKKLAALNTELEKDSRNANKLFQRAQLLKYLNKPKEAIDDFLQEVQLSNSKDDVWVSKFMLGECYEQLDEWERAIYWYLEAFQHDPSRNESLRKIATYYRNHSKNDLAYMFAKHGSRIPFPEDPPYPLCDMYEYQFAEEISIAAYYTAFRKEGEDATADLVVKRGVPWFVKDQAYRNLIYYAPLLKDAKFTRIEIELPLVEEGFEQRYAPMNPSILRTPKGYKVICRAVNYTQTGAKIFNTVDKEGIFRTKNYLLSYDRNFQLVSQHEIVEELPRERFYNLVQGLEDCRIFKFNNSYWFTCTTSDTNPTGNRQISLCKLPEYGLGKTIEVESLTPLVGPDLERCEKNWLPFELHGKFCVIYGYDPFVIYTPNIETGECIEYIRYKPKHDFSSFRGSAAPVPFDHGYLMLVHEVAMLHDYTRCYFHRFVFLNQDLQIEMVSSPFMFQHAGIEFCTSMTLDHTGKNLIIPVGIEDREAYLCSIDLDTVRSLLHPLPSTQEFPYQK